MTICLIINFLFLAGCDYEISPWSTDVDCSTDVSVEENIKRLKHLESIEGERDNYKVALVSDPQMYPGAFEYVINHINTLDDVAFLIISGDFAETGIAAEFEWSCKVMQKSNKPFFAVAGNHDALSFGKEIWAKVFGPYDFSFTYQNSKFIAYNDNKYEFENVPDRGWLAEESAVGLGEVRQHTIATSHNPPWDNDLELSHYFKDIGVDLTVHGHKHKFDFWQLVDVMLPHYVTSFTKEKEYGLLTVSSRGLILENCRKDSCSVVTPRER